LVGGWATPGTNESLRTNIAIPCASNKWIMSEPPARGNKTQNG
jgi:hypothetical protein